MIDAKTFEKKFVDCYKERLDKWGIGVLRLYAGNDDKTYRGIKFLSQPIDVFPAGHHFRTGKIGKYKIEPDVEDVGRGEDEIILKSILSMQISEYKEYDNEQILEAIKRLKLPRENENAKLTSWL